MMAQDNHARDEDEGKSSGRKRSVIVGMLLDNPSVIEGFEGGLRAPLAG
jgi:hypothetical protein